MLVYPDGFGIRPVLQQMACELAEHGYYVLVPNVFYRHGPAPVIKLPEHIGDEARPAIFAQLMPMIKSHTADRARRDADAFNPAALQRHGDRLLSLLGDTLTTG